MVTEKGDNVEIKLEMQELWILIERGDFKDRQGGGEGTP